MRNLSVVAISGSPSPTSKTAIVAEQALSLISENRPDIEIAHVRARDIDPVALLSGNMADPDLAELARLIEGAHGIIVATPIFKASYSGLLKATLDVLPQFAFAGKVVLPIGTGGSIAHVLALDYGMRPVLQSMGARHIVQARFVAEQDFLQDEDKIQLSPASTVPMRHAVRNFLHSLTDAEETRLLGHPQPA